MSLPAPSHPLNCSAAACKKDFLTFDLFTLCFAVVMKFESYLSVIQNQHVAFPTHFPFLHHSVITVNGRQSISRNRVRFADRPDASRPVGNDFPSVAGSRTESKQRSGFSASEIYLPSRAGQ